MTVRRMLALAAAVAATGTATAAPYAPFDVRAAGMGGTGVASAKAASAALFNPAMLSAQREGDAFQIVLGVGATLADEDEMQDQFDELETTMDALNASIDLIDTSAIAIDSVNAELANAANITAQLSSQLNALNNDQANVLPGAGFGFGVPGPKLGVGVFIGGNAQLAVSTQIAGNDTNRLDRYVALLGDGQVDAGEVTANPDLFVNTIGGSDEVEFATDINGEFDAQSTARALGVAIAEAGIAFSHRFELASGGRLSAGVTPKAVEILTYDYVADADNFEADDLELTERTDSAFDMDIGVVYKTAADSDWQYALVAKNLVGGDYRTAAGANIEIATQVRAGVARTTKRTTLALDLDLTENSGTTRDDVTQFLGFGAEYDLKYLQLRAGYRANLASSDIADVATVGLGLGPIDISAQAADGTVGAFLQLGFGW
ncbi:MAG: conjugal transfer protein TraF [Gammaproteobacteria bacterium]